MTRLLSLQLIFVFSGIHCNNEEEIDGKYSSAIKEPISTPDDFLSLREGKDILPKLIRLLTDAEYREGRNKALETMIPSKDPLMPRILDDDILDMIPDIPEPPKHTKIHMHHIFPPHIIRPLQRAIVKKLIHYVKNDPVKKFKKKMVKKVRIGTVAVGLGLGVRELKELKLRPPTAQYKVTGLVDLSGQKKKGSYDEHGEFGDNHQERYKRSATFPVDPDYERVKDYKLIPSFPSKHHWPFHESKEEIYEKWNKFPAHVHTDPFHHKVKYLHKSFHELHPDILHLVKDVEGLVHGAKSHVIRSSHSHAPDLESPLVIAGQLVKIADSLIPSIRIRIPFLEYLKKSFHEKSKPKVVYVKQRPKIKYVGLPYKEEEEEEYAMGEPEPMQMEGPAAMPEPVALPEPTPGYDHRRQITPQHNPGPQYGSGNYEMITDLRSPEQYEPSQLNQQQYTQMFEQALPLYQDKKAKAKA